MTEKKMSNPAEVIALRKLLAEGRALRAELASNDELAKERDALRDAVATLTRKLDRADKLVADIRRTVADYVGEESRTHPITRLLDDYYEDAR